MRKVLVDTNVWLDVILARPAFLQSSLGALMACVQQGIDMYIAATSLKDLFYFAEKSAGADAAYAAVEQVLRLSELASVDSAICTRALHLEKPDYEDGIVAACAEIEGTEAIISRDSTSFDDLDIPKCTPDEFTKSLGYEPVDF